MVSANHALSNSAQDSKMGKYSQHAQSVGKPLMVLPLPGFLHISYRGVPPFPGPRSQQPQLTRDCKQSRHIKSERRRGWLKQIQNKKRKETKISDHDFGS